MISSGKKWCGFHKKMEPISHFYTDPYSTTGYMNCCKEIHKQRVERWQENHLEYKRAVARVHSEYRRNKISFLQKRKKLNTLRMEFNI